MFIDLNTIGSEGLSFTRSVRLHGLEGPSRESIPDLDALVEGTITPAPGGADLRARVGATVPLTCARCLETFSWDIRTEFAWKVLRQAPEEPAPEQDVDADDEASVLVATEGRIGLEDIASEQLYLNLPLKPICAPACKGLCPTCGVNRNLTTCACASEEIDPRLAPLLPLTRKLQGS
jgi:uncharacterized metal-binding protein YceD (DUF177 family)